MVCDMKEIQIRKNDAGQRLDRFVGKAVPLLPESLLQKYIRLKRIKRNGKGAKRDVRLVEGDVLQLYINDEFFEKPTEHNAWLKIATPRLDIVYEDENILLADKKPGVLCHSAGEWSWDTLISNIQAYLRQTGEWDPKAENAFTPALCNRIDRNTGGIVIAAKTAEALRILNQKIRDRELDKRYLAVVEGTPRPETGVLKGYDGGDVTIDHGGEGQIDSNIDLTVPSITLSDRDSITAARSSLNGSLASIIDGVSSLNTNTGSHTQALIQDVQAISSQLNKIGDTLAGAADQSEDDNNLFEDVSDSDTDGDTEGKVFNCINLGEVNADINAGGITGAMARENDLDPEDDTKTSGSSSLNVTYKTRIVVRDCINKGAVNVKKKGGGGIVGSMDMGSVLQSYNFGNLESDDADYVGGIAGQSKSIIRRSAAKCRLSGDNYVGGIAGSGFTITGSRSFVLADGDEYVGAIAGGLESSNSITNLNSALQDSESEQSGNYFVSETLGGIDGVSYAGQAEPLSFQEFCDLTAQEGMPDEFRNVTLNFVASQVTVKAVTVEYGAAFDMANAPELPAKGGYTAEWSDFDHDHVVFDQTIEAVYTPLDSVVQSGDTRNGLPILLAEGAFGTAEVTLTPSSESPGAVGTLLECWEITLPEDHSDSHVLHYLAPSDNTVVYLRDADGSWRKVDTTEDGSYLVFTAMTDETILAAVEKPGIPLPILIGGAVAAVLLVILSILGHKHRKKRLTKKAEQERKRAEETENG